MTTFTHIFPVRIYYEDTDHGGVVYYANYLKFMERARTEFLRAGGLELDDLERDFGIMFAVTEVNIRYLIPARFNDALEVESRLTLAAGARLAFVQRIRRHDSVLVEAQVHLACIDNAGKPRRIPAPVMRIMKAEKSKERQL